MRDFNCASSLFADFDFKEEPVEYPAFESRSLNVAGKHLETTPVFDAYWRFAAERQKIFFRKIRKTNGTNAPLTSNPILAEYKFTNAYRASDRVSQYLIRNVIYREDLPKDVENVFFRTLLFKLFNKIETWDAVESAFGKVTLDRVLVRRIRCTSNGATKSKRAQLLGCLHDAVCEQRIWSCAQTLQSFETA